MTGEIEMTEREKEDKNALGEACGGSDPDRGTGGKNGEFAENEETDLRYRDGKEVAKGGLLGFFIGLAVIVPGVSGSAVAIIFRLYEKLLYAFGNLLKRFKKCVGFLIPIAIGAVIGVACGFFSVRYLLKILPFAVVALFAGLMIGAFPAVTDQLGGERATPQRKALFLAGFIVPVAVSLLSVFLLTGERSLENLSLGHYVLFLALGYAVAITQVVPGLSATALLMMFGYFAPLMASVGITYWKSSPQVFAVYACLIVGFLTGLLTFSKFLSGLLVKRRAPTFFTVAGLSLGSAVTMFFNPDMYAVYQNWANGGFRIWELLLGIVLFLGGMFASYRLVLTERGKENRL